MKLNFAELAIDGLKSIGSFSRYLLTGGLLFVIDLLVFLMLVSIGGLEPFHAQAISRTLGAIVGFFGHRHITFMQTRNHARRSGATQGAAYLTISVTMLLVTPFVLLFFLRISGGQLLMAKLLTEVFAVLVVYICLKFVFAAERKE